MWTEAVKGFQAVEDAASQEMERGGEAGGGGVGGTELGGVVGEGWEGLKLGNPHS
jgi:hypothetical protein